MQQPEQLMLESVWLTICSWFIYDLSSSWKFYFNSQLKANYAIELFNFWWNWFFFSNTGKYRYTNTIEIDEKIDNENVHFS